MLIDYDKNDFEIIKDDFNNKILAFVQITQKGNKYYTNLFTIDEDEIYKLNSSELELINVEISDYKIKADISRVSMEYGLLNKFSLDKEDIYVKSIVKLEFNLVDQVLTLTKI